MALVSYASAWPYSTCPLQSTHWSSDLDHIRRCIDGIHPSLGGCRTQPLLAGMHHCEEMPAVLCITHVYTCSSRSSNEILAPLLHSRCTRRLVSAFSIRHCTSMPAQPRRDMQCLLCLQRLCVRWHTSSSAPAVSATSAAKGLRAAGIAVTVWRSRFQSPQRCLCPGHTLRTATLLPGWQATQSYAWWAPLRPRFLILCDCSGRPPIVRAPVEHMGWGIGGCGIVDLCCITPMASTHHQYL